MTGALAMRSSVGLSVLHDRAPLFVRLPDGDLRNGYTVKIVNKGPNVALFELRSDGLNGASLAEADEGLGPASRLGLMVKGDSVGTFRVTVAGEPDHLVEWLAGYRFPFAQHRYRRADGVSLTVHGAAMRSMWRFFPLAVVAGLGLVVVVNAGMVYAALHTLPRAGRQRRLRSEQPLRRGA